MTMKKNPEYLSISEFAKIAEVSRKLLIYYDNTGVFSPKYVAPNGYRYYSHEQIYMISVITMFRELGTPLSEIKEYMDRCNPEDASDFLEQRKNRIIEKIRQMEGARDMLTIKLEELKKGLDQSVTDIYISDEPEEPVFISERLAKKKIEITDDEWMDFYTMCREKQVMWGYPEGFLVSSENLLNRKNDIAEHIICHVGNKRYANSYIPAGKYVIACGEGSFHDSEPVYKRLFKYIEDHDLQITGNSYEKRQIDEAATEDGATQRMLVKIQVK